MSHPMRGYDPVRETRTKLDTTPASTSGTSDMHRSLYTRLGSPTPGSNDTYPIRPSETNSENAVRINQERIQKGRDLNKMVSRKSNRRGDTELTKDDINYAKNEPERKFVKGFLPSNAQRK